MRKNIRIPINYLYWGSTRIIENWWLSKTCINKWTWTVYFSPSLLIWITLNNCNTFPTWIHCTSAKTPPWIILSCITTRISITCVFTLLQSTILNSYRAWIIITINKTSCFITLSTSITQIFWTSWISISISII